MKNLLIFSPYYPPHVGGLESHAREFNEHMSEIGFTITVFTPRLPKSALATERMGNGTSSITIYRFPAWEIIGNYPLPRIWTREFWAIFRLLRKEKFDAVISRTRFFCTSIMAMVFVKKNHVFWMHIEHGSDYVQLSNKIIGGIARLYDFIIGRWVFASADVVVANSRASAGFAKKIYGKRDYTIIYRGVEKEKITSAVGRPDLKKKYAGKIVISYAGRLIDGKGITDLLEAIASLPDLPLICWVVGDGPQKQYLEKKTRSMGLSEKIIFFGEKSHSDSLDLIKSSDIFVNPSYTEGMPTSVIEAALLKKAIIATNVGGTKEIISETGGICLVSPRDKESIARGISALAKDGSLRKGMGEMAFAGVANRFDWKGSAKLYDKIFTAVKR